MGLPLPTKVKSIYHYVPWWPTCMMCVTIIAVAVWVHHTSVLRNSVNTMLNILGDNTGADNFSTIASSVTATSVLFMIITCGMYGVMLWGTFDTTRMDVEGEVKDTRNWMYQQAMLGLRIAWWMVMTWLVVLITGCGIVGSYVSNLAFMIKTTVAYNGSPKLEPLPPGYVPSWPNCPTQCVNLWVVNYIDTPKVPSCFCDPPTLNAALAQCENAQSAVAGMLVGVFLMYIIGGFWRSEMSKQYITFQSNSDFAHLLAEGGGAGGGGSGRGGAGRGKKP